MDNRQIQDLIEKYGKQGLSEAETRQLNDWYRETGYADAIYPENEDAVKQRILARLHRHTAPARKTKVWSWPLKAGAAAAVALIVFSVAYFSGDHQVRKESLTEIRPGSNKALLTLSSGKTINLTAAASGQLAEEAGISISKNKEGQVIYRVAGQHGKPGTTDSGETLWNTVSTPRGGQYQVLLPDGTAVWLNAASSIRFPASFGNLKTRKVELDGEAYFEVAKDQAHPFVVKSGPQELQVIGTHFNLSNYPGEKTLRTTLLEGRVRVSAAGQEVILKPGQQSVLSGSGLQVGRADLEQVMSWKNALFVFDHDDLASIMNKISRWYDVEIVYMNEEVKNEVFSGKVSRSENVDEVLKKLSLTDAVKFKIERRRILVMK